MSFEFDTSHPHYTPSWLSKQVAELVPAGFVGDVVDPACGSGNLLAAAVSHMARERGTPNVRLWGIDVSQEATRICRATLRSFAPTILTRVRSADFLRCGRPRGLSDRRIVLMNPPFLGYGLIPESTRDHIRGSLNMTGRFNLSHAFVVKAIRDYRPELLVAILPSNWIYSRTSAFRSRLEEQAGEWSWEDIGDAFDRVAAHVGVLTWHAGGLTETRSGPQARIKDVASFEVRQGVATGSDEAFRTIAEMGIGYGTIVEAVVGRNVDSGVANRLIWVPSREPRSSETWAGVADKLPVNLLRLLEARSCVRTNGRHVLEYHESFPEWFLGQPKLLLPEVVSGKLRVEVDRGGGKLPLHSTFAVRVPHLDAAESLSQYLRSDIAMASLRKICPRLSGGAIRLTAGAIRNCVAAWQQSCLLITGSG